MQKSNDAATVMPGDDDEYNDHVDDDVDNVGNDDSTYGESRVMAHGINFGTRRLTDSNSSHRRYRIGNIVSVCGTPSRYVMLSRHAVYGTSSALASTALATLATTTTTTLT